MLDMKANCEKCQADTPADRDAMICSFECTWCPPCAAELGSCPNCGGELQTRPRRAG